MEKGDLIAIYRQGEAILFCLIGLYESEDNGGVMAVLALIDPEKLRHIPLEILQHNQLEPATVIN